MPLRANLPDFFVRASPRSHPTHRPPASGDGSLSTNIFRFTGQFFTERKFRKETGCPLDTRVCARAAGARARVCGHGTRIQRPAPGARPERGREGEREGERERERDYCLSIFLFLKLSWFLYIDKSYKNVF